MLELVNADGQTNQVNLGEPAMVSAPEPSTWAMMLIGFAGLGFAAIAARGRGVSRLSRADPA